MKATIAIVLLALSSVTFAAPLKMPAGPVLETTACPFVWPNMKSAWERAKSFWFQGPTILNN